jgi:DNA-binding transcriptional LysR family regulator
MELRHLRYFVAIAEERSFTRAAERLWVAQPGLSSQIRRLEDELGVRLFVRHTRGVDLTDAGELFLDRARVALAAADEARATGRDLAAGLVGSVRLGIATEAHWQGADALLDDFGRERPNVELTVLESHGGTLIRDLRDGRLDAVLAPSMFGSPELRTAVVGSQPWAVLVARGHQLAVEGSVAVEELDGQAIAVTGHRDGAAYDRAVASVLTDAGIAPELESAGAGSALHAAVAAGRALALTTAPGLAAGALVARELEPERPVEFALYWRDETPAPALQHFIRAAQDGVHTVHASVRPALAAVA